MSTETYLVSVSTELYLNSISTYSYFRSQSTEWQQSVSTDTTTTTSEFIAAPSSFNYFFYAVIPGCIFFTIMISAIFILRRHSPDDNMKKSPSFYGAFSEIENGEVKKEIDERNWFMLGIFGIPSEEPVGSIRKDDKFSFELSKESLNRNLTRQNRMVVEETKEKIAILNKLAKSKSSESLFNPLKLRIDKNFSFDQPNPKLLSKKEKKEECIRDKIKTLNKIAQSKSREILNGPLNIRIDKDFTFDESVETRQKIKQLNEFLHVGNDNSDEDEEKDEKILNQNGKFNLWDEHMDLELDDVDMA